MNDTPAARGPGRPRKEPSPEEKDMERIQSELDEEAARRASAAEKAKKQAEAQVKDAERLAEEQAAAKAKASAERTHIKGEALMEVILLRDYVPHHIENDEGEMVSQGEITKKVPKGSVVRLPKWEVHRALKEGIATVTENTFS